MFFEREKMFYKKTSGKILYFRREKMFYKKNSRKAKDSAGQERLNCPLPGVKFIIYHCFQLFSISSLIISTYLRALEMS